MARVERNSIILTKKEIKIYNKKFDEITTPIEWVKVMQEIYKLADIDFYIEWNPVFTQYTYYNDVIPCFKGSVKGINTDLTGEGRRVYSFSAGSRWSTIHRAQNGSGGGGEIWSYDYLLLDIRKFPAMLEKYGKEIAETTIAQEKLKLQKSFDEDIKTQLRKISSLRFAFECETVAQSFKEKLKALEKAKKTLENALQNERDLYVAKGFEATGYEISNPTSPFLDLSEYTQLIRALHANKISYTLSDKIHKAEAEYENFVKNNPELFI